MHRILITGALHPVALEILNGARDVQADYRPDLPYEEILPIIGAYQALITRSETRVTRELIDAAPRLKVIARAAVGVGNVDVDYATDKGILVINTPGKNTNAAAELTLALLLAAMRKIVPAHRRMEARGWERHQYTGSELAGKTIGIVGLGNVGHRVARFARAFDMEVLAHDPYIADDVFERHHAAKAALDDLVAAADVVTLHVPLTPQTEHLIDAARIARMKSGVVIVNTARGGIVDEAALLDALRSGKVAAAGIDTWAEEPPSGNPFADLPQVVMTPHIGASTREAQLRVGESIAEQTLRALRDEVVDYPVNMPRLNVLSNPRVKFYAVLAEKLGRFAVQSLDFNPRRIEVMYRGELSAEEGLMVRRAFLKGFLRDTAEETITFVNAEQKAGERRIEISEADDPHFTDYPSAVQFEITDHEHSFKIGGVVFGENNYRLSQVNDFNFEVIPDGHLLYVINIDRPGVIGDIGTTLARNEINISQFELSRNMPGGQAMSLLRVDTPVDNRVLEALRAIRNVVSVRRITI
ncbi:MAG: phosphoglycerate dehydrogenase [SAR324 cluster bacterium]|nr:phosphoglycerate dehydrogenase [SAR324 cluster bacterium]